jgi:hypothetical protein
MYRSAASHVIAATLRVHGWTRLFSMPLVSHLLRACFRLRRCAQAAVDALASISTSLTAAFGSPAISARPVATWWSTLRRQTLRLFDDEPTCKLLYSDGLLRAAISRRGLDAQRPSVVDNLSHLAYLIAAIVARIIAPVLGHKLPPPALVGDSSVRAARLAHLMGCGMPTDWHRRPPAALGWPYVLTGTRQQKRKGAKRLRKASANMVVAVTSMELRARGLTPCEWKG